MLLSTRHVALAQAWVDALLTRHATDLVPRIAAVLDLEHLGALPGRVDRQRADRPAPEYGFGCSFAGPTVIAAARTATVRAAVTGARVLRPLVLDTTGRSPRTVLAGRRVPVPARRRAADGPLASSTTEVDTADHHRQDASFEPRRGATGVRVSRHRLGANR